MRKLKLELLVLQPSSLEALRRLGVALTKYRAAMKQANGITKTTKGRKAIFDRVRVSHEELLKAAATLTALTTEMEGSDARILTQD